MMSQGLQFAVIAHVSEQLVTPVDARMEAIGGVVFRAPLSKVEADR